MFRRWHWTTTWPRGPQEEVSSGRGTASAKACRRASDQSWKLAQLLQTGECPGDPPSSPCLLPHRPRPSLWPCHLLLSGFLSLSSCPVRLLSPACLFSEGRGLYQGSPSTPLLPCPPPRSRCVCGAEGHRAGGYQCPSRPHTPPSCWVFLLTCSHFL